VDAYGRRRSFNKGGMHCLAAGTLVTTQCGDIPIELVEPGTLVATRQGWRPVRAAWLANPDAEVLHVTLANGRHLVGTGEHLVWVVNLGWCRLDALKVMDEVLTWAGGEDSWQGRSESLSEGSLTTGIRTLPDGVRERTSAARLGPTSTASSGNSTMAQSLRAITSTISTGTPATTRSTTLSAYQSRSIAASIAMSTTSALQSTWRTLKRYVREPQPGILRRKELSGTGSTVDAQLQPGPQPRGSASSAGGVIPRSGPGSTAPTSASSEPMPPIRRAGNPALAHAERTTCESATPREAGVTHVVQLRKLPTRVPVYDLTVDDVPEFFANGVLVHNCLDAARVMAVAWKQEQIGDLDAEDEFEPIMDSFL
jgi:hypothetical protein